MCRPASLSFDQQHPTVLRCLDVDAVFLGHRALGATDDPAFTFKEARDGLDHDVLDRLRRLRLEGAVRRRS